MDTCTQLRNCSALMDLLEDLKPEQYDHTVFRMNRITHRCCAMGHAAYKGIGGLRIGTATVPWLADNPQLMIDEAADLVFGTGAWERVFNVEALNERLRIDERGIGLYFDWFIDNEPAKEDEVYARQRGELALQAIRAALADHMVLLS